MEFCSFVGVFFERWSSNLAVNVSCVSRLQRQQSIHTPFKHGSRVHLLVWIMAAAGLHCCWAPYRERNDDCFHPNGFWAQCEAFSIAKPPYVPLLQIRLKCSLATEWLNVCTVNGALVAAPHNLRSLNNCHWCCSLTRHHLFFHCSVVML